jgi:hypothetical protein
MIRLAELRTGEHGSGQLPVLETWWVAQNRLDVWYAGRLSSSAKENEIHADLEFDAHKRSFQVLILTGNVKMTPVNCQLCIMRFRLNVHSFKKFGLFLKLGLLLLCNALRANVLMN